MQSLDDMGDALRTELRARARKLRKNVVRAERGDAEAVHDARTNARRLRVGLGVMQRSVFEGAKLAKLEREVRRVEKELGGARDWDVFLAHVEAHARGSGGRDLDGLAELVRNKHDRAAKKLARAIGSKTVRRTLRASKRVLAGRAGLRPPPGDATKAEPRLVRHFVAPELWRAYEALLAYETRLPADAAVAHRIRSAARALRYLVELFEDALPPGARAVGDRLHEIQDRLGDMHDHDVALARIAKWRRRGDLADTPGLLEYVRERERARSEILAELPTTWRELAGARFTRALTDASVFAVREAVAAAPTQPLLH